MNRYLDERRLLGGRPCVEVLVTFGRSITAAGVIAVLMGLIVLDSKMAACTLGE
jgi:hypothetical protein